MFFRSSASNVFVLLFILALPSAWAADTLRVENRSSSVITLSYRAGQKFQTTAGTIRSVSTIQPGASVDAPTVPGREWIASESKTRRAVKYHESKGGWRSGKMRVTDKDLARVKGKRNRANFRNTTDGNVAAYMELSGELFPYTIIAPGRTLRVADSWVGQTWDFRDANTGKKIIRVRAGDSDGSMAIAWPKGDEPKVAARSAKQRAKKAKPKAERAKADPPKARKAPAVHSGQRTAKIVVTNRFGETLRVYEKAGNKLTQRGTVTDGRALEIDARVGGEVVVTDSKGRQWIETSKVPRRGKNIVVTAGGESAATEAPATESKGSFIGRLFGR